MENPLFRTEQEVGADFSQFYLRFMDALATRDDNSDVSIAFFFAPGELLLCAARQWGQLPITLIVHKTRPDVLNESWRDVVEISALATYRVILSGWEENDDDLSIPLRAGADYRVRYSISDMDAVDGLRAEDVVEQYLVELWEESPSSAVIVRAGTASGRSWQLGHLLDPLRQNMVAAVDNFTDEQRVKNFADQVFAARPDIQKELLAGLPGVLTGVASMAAALERAPDPTHLSPEEKGNWSRTKFARVTRWVNDSAIEGFSDHSEIL